jgi:hypothetical protein
MTADFLGGIGFLCSKGGDRQEHGFGPKHATMSYFEKRDLR